jgi:hypothetical protein
MCKFLFVYLFFYIFPQFSQSLSYFTLLIFLSVFLSYFYLFLFISICYFSTLLSPGSSPLAEVCIWPAGNGWLWNGANISLSMIPYSQPSNYQQLSEWCPSQHNSDQHLFHLNKMRQTTYHPNSWSMFFAHPFFQL